MARTQSSLPLRHFNARTRLLTAAVAACFAAPAFALPTAPVVTNGSASFAQNGGNLTVTNSSGAIINWNTFSIGANEAARFIQPSASSSVLNRVVGVDPSQIYGTLSSNGRVWLINTAGILVGPGARIDTAAFVASTLQVRDADFLAGRLTFQATAGAGNVVNQGAITTPTGGSVYLIGANVSNDGIITTPGGETILAAGQTVNLIDTGTPGVAVEITGAAGNATNLGQIVADAGRIGIAGVIVKNSGTLNASSVVNEGGRVFLKASQDTYVDGAGRIVATGTKGGRVEVLGSRVAVMDNASIDASGANGGGTILVGGDYQGKNPAVQNASISYFGPNASLKADAGGSGDGGKVIVWADDTTRAYGTVSARGGANSGNGGFVETSGHRYLDFQGLVDTRAPNGLAGTLLLDPADIIISNSADTPTPYGGAFSAGVYSGTWNLLGASNLSWSTIISQLGLGNVTITTTGSLGSGDITVSTSPGPVVGSNITISHTDSWGTWTNTWYGAGYNSPNSLSLLANRAVNINAPFGNAGGGAINIMAGWNGVSTASPTLYGGFTAGQSININSGGGIISMGPVNLQAVDTVAINGGMSMAGIDMNAGALSIAANTISLSGGGAGVYNNAEARIATNGNQSFTVGTANSAGGLFLQGSYGGVVYGDGAEIGLYGTGGVQSFTINNGATVQLSGGSGNGMVPVGQWSGDCSVAAICSGNGAHIRTAGSGGQTFNFTAGGKLNLYGGSVGNDNAASIANKGLGSQTISGNPNIWIQGGFSGGAILTGATETLYFDNAAGIESKYGNQQINAASLTMDGGTAAYGGAFLTAPTQNITVSGALNMTAYGSAPLPTALDFFGKPVHIDPIIIGFDAPNTINLSVGSLTLTGGSHNSYGGSPAMIGGYRVPTNVNITSAGNIMLGGPNQWSAKIGSWGGYGGSVSLTSTTGTISLGNGQVGTGAAGTTSLFAYNGITQAATGMIGASSLTASSTLGSVSLPGLNSVGFVSASAPGGVTYTGASAVNLGFSTSVSGTVNVTGYGGTFVSNTGTVEPSALTVRDAGSSYGWADYLTGNNVTVGNNYSLMSLSGGVMLYSSGTVALNSIAGFQPSTNPLYGFINIWSNVGTTTSGSLSTSADLLLGTAGNLSATGSLNAKDLSLFAAGTLTATGASLGAAGNVSMWSNNGITLTNSSVTASGGNAYLGNVSLGSTGLPLNTATGTPLGFTGGGNLTLVGSSVSAPLGSVYGGTSSNIRLNNGSSLSAGRDVYLKLIGATSTLYLNDVAGLAPSMVSTALPYTIYLDFPGRAASGSIVIDGLPAKSPVATVAGGSGFYAAGLPATEGAGLRITYGALSTAALDPCVINPASCAPPPSPSNLPPIIVVPPVGPTAGGGTLSGGTVGGGEDQFGGSSSGDKENGKDKKSSDSSGDKKDEKSSKKPVGKCSA